MATADPCRAYQEYQVQTLSQEKLVLMLYDGAIKFCSQALKALEQKDYARTNNYLLRAQDILNELMVSLNREAGEIADNLHRLYDFMYRWLVEANVKKSAKHIIDVRDILVGLRDAWEEATRRYHSHDYRTQPGSLSFRG
ncbi:MAG: flagellar secretion chaperone FliS [Clostridia bacterium]|nr:flagellar secretion chaperone FliS [Clostridia bacterium]